MNEKWQYLYIGNKPVLEKSWLPYLQVLCLQYNRTKTTKMISLTRLSKAPTASLQACPENSLSSRSLTVAGNLSVCQDPGGCSCHDLVVPDDLSLLQLG